MCSSDLTLDVKTRERIALAVAQVDGCERYAQIATCGRKASPVDHPQEDRHGFEAVHDYSMN